MNTPHNDKYEASAQLIRAAFKDVPETAVILGSGLGAVSSLVEGAVTLSFEEAGFLSSSVAGHGGKLICGRINGAPALIQSGRLHFYEGHPLSGVVHPVRAMALAGVRNMLMLNAAGGIADHLSPGSLMLITDHINFVGENPLADAASAELGERFTDMSHSYDEGLGSRIKKAARAIGAKLDEGVYVWVRGPSYETPAEIRMFELMGASAVGMSTVPEVIAARHLGVKVAGISLITNKAAGRGGALSHSEVVAAGAGAGKVLSRLIEAFFNFN